MDRDNAQGKLLHITRFCTDDGPGIRTTVFLKGCPLRCLWCHNPESQSAQPELALHIGKCSLCGTCAQVCPQGAHILRPEGHILDRTLCVACGKCTGICPEEALTLWGKTASVEEVYAILERDRVFYEASGGGITLSGGEPLLQGRFAEALLRRCREGGLSTAIETCGFAPGEVFMRCITQCDLVLMDIKALNEADHRTWTGRSLAPILANLMRLDASSVPYYLRLPIIPGLNDTDAHFAAAAQLWDSLHRCTGLEVMPYHTLGAYKYGTLGRDYSLESQPDAPKEMKQAWLERILSFRK